MKIRPSNILHDYTLPQRFCFCYGQSLAYSSSSASGALWHVVRSPRFGCVVSSLRQGHIPKTHVPQRIEGLSSAGHRCGVQDLSLGIKPIVQSINTHGPWYGKDRSGKAPTHHKRIVQFHLGTQQLFPLIKKGSLFSFHPLSNGAGRDATAQPISRHRTLAS